MGFFTRALSRLFGQQQRIAPFPGSAREADRFWNLFGLGNQRTRTDEQWARTFGENARLRVPLDAIATDVASVPWHLYRRGRKGLVEVDSHPFLDLMRLPHPMMPWSVWCWVVQIYLDLVGKAPVRMSFDSDGRPTQLMPFPPHWIMQLPHAGDKTFHVNWWGGDTERIPAGEILWLYRPDTLNPFGDGLGLARALDDEVNQDEAMAKFNNYYFRHSAFLGAIVNLPGCDPEEVAEMFRQDREGIIHACRTYITDGSDMKIENLSPKLRELNFQEGRAQTGDFIREGFGLDGARVGRRGDSRVQANDDAADHHQQSKIVKPRINYLAESFNLFVLPLYGERNLILKPEDPVKESKEETRLKTEVGVRIGVMTTNEARQNLGMDPLPQGDVLSVPVNNVVLVNSQGDLVGDVQKAVKEMNSAGGDPGNQVQAKMAAPTAPAPQQQQGGK